MNLNPTDTSQLKAILDAFYPVSDSTFEQLLRCFTKVEYKDKTILVSSNDKEPFIYLINSGYVRSFYVKDEKEHTTWFGSEGDFITSFYTLFQKKPGYENIQLLSDSEFFQMKTADFYPLLEQNHEVKQLYIKILEYGYLYWEKRFMLMQVHNAKDRYRFFVESNKKALQLLPLNVLASYLGIAQETLSRIRSGQ